MSWPEFFQRLNPAGNVTLRAMWRMSDGNSLRANLPSPNQIREDDFVGEAAEALPYKLYQILELEFEPDPQTCDVPQQLETIEQAARVSGLIYRRKAERIIVRSPYSC